MSTLVGIVCAVGNALIDGINSAWTALDWDGFSGCYSWFLRLDAWAPCSELYRVIALVVQLAGIMLMWRGGKWLIGTLRGSGTT